MHETNVVEACQEIMEYSYEKCYTTFQEALTEYPDSTWVDENCEIRDPEQLERFINPGRFYDYFEDISQFMKLIIIPFLVQISLKLKKDFNSVEHTIENEDDGRLEIELSQDTNDIILHVSNVLNFVKKLNF